MTTDDEWKAAKKLWESLDKARLNVKSSWDHRVATQDDWLDTYLFILKLCKGK